MKENEILYVDCLDPEIGIPSYPDNSFDIIFFDPPFNAKKDYGVYKDNLPLLEYIKKMQNVVFECERVSKNGIGIYLDSWRFYLWWHYIFPNSEPIIIWKRSPGFSSKNKIIASFHVILTNIIANKNIVGLWPDLHPVANGYYWRLTGDYVSENHPAQTSLEIVKRFIKNFSQRGVLIMDPFMGTGATAQACIELNRNWFGYEINPNYSIYFEERIKNCKKEPVQVNLSKFTKNNNFEINS